MVTGLSGVEFGQRERHKPAALDWQNKNFARASRFLYISLPSLLDYDVKLPNFTFYGGRGHNQQDSDFFSFGT